MADSPTHANPPPPPHAARHSSPRRSHMHSLGVDATAAVASPAVAAAAASAPAKLAAPSTYEAGMQAVAMAAAVVLSDAVSESSSSDDDEREHRDVNWADENEGEEEEDDEVHWRPDLLPAPSPGPASASVASSTMSAPFSSASSAPFLPPAHIHSQVADHAHVTISHDGDSDGEGGAPTSTFPEGFSASNPLGPRTHLRDVVAWEQLSHAYALGYGLSADGQSLEPIAIWDKTYRRPDFELSRGNIKETLAMGFHTQQAIHSIARDRTTQHVHTVMQLLEVIFEPKRVRRNSADPAPGGNSSSSSSSSSSGSSGSAAASSSSSSPMRYRKARIEMVTAPDTFFSDPNNAFRFRAGVGAGVGVVGEAPLSPQSEQAQAQQSAVDQQPRRTVRLTDIDWETMVRLCPPVRQLLLRHMRDAELRELMDTHPPLLPPEQMSTAERAQRSPTYLYLHSLLFKRVRIMPSGDPSESSRPIRYRYELYLNRSRPAKIIDLKHRESSFPEATARAAITNILRGGIGAIPFYGPPQVVVAAAERIFDYGDVLSLQHHHQAMELILESLRGNPRSPFTHPVFTRQRLMDSVFYLLRSSIFFSSIIKNGLSDNATLAENYIAALEEKRRASLVYLQRRRGADRLQLVEIPYTHFALGLSRDHKTGAITKFKLYVLCFTKIGRKKKPHAAVDFIKVHRERRKRQALQYLLVASNLLWFPVPAVGSVAKIAYKESVIREIHRRQMWEHAVLAHVSHHKGEMARLIETKFDVSSGVARKYEELAIRILEERAFSPLDLTHAEADERRRAVESWMDRGYGPLSEWRPSDDPAAAAAAARAAAHPLDSMSSTSGGGSSFRSATERDVDAESDAAVAAVGPAASPSSSPPAELLVSEAATALTEVCLSVPSHAPAPSR